MKKLWCWLGLHDWKYFGMDTRICQSCKRYQGLYAAGLDRKEGGGLIVTETEWRDE